MSNQEEQQPQESIKAERVTWWTRVCRFMRAIRIFLVWILLIFCGLDAWLECIGVPEFISKELCRRIGGSYGQFSCSYIRAGVYDGVNLIGVSGRWETSAGTLVVLIPKLQLKQDTLELLMGNVCVEDIDVTLGRVWLEIRDENNAVQRLDVTHIRVRGVVDGADDLVCYITGRYDNVEINLRAQLGNFSHLIGRILSQESSEEAPVVDSALQAKILSVQRKIDEYFPVGSQTKLMLDVRGDLGSMRGWHLDGDISTSNVTTPLGECSRFECVFGADIQKVTVQELSFETAQRGSFKGSGAFYPMMLEWEMTGHLSTSRAEVESIAVKLGAKPSALQVISRFPCEKMDVGITVNRSSVMKLPRARFLVGLSEDNPNSPEVFERGTAEVILDKQSVLLQKCELEYAGSTNREQSRIEVQGKVDLRKKSIHCGLNGKVKLGALVERLNDGNQLPCVAFGKGLCEVESVFDLDDWTKPEMARVNGKIVQHGGELCFLMYDTMTIPFSVSDGGLLSIHDMRLEKDGKNWLDMSAHCNIHDLITKKKTSLVFDRFALQSQRRKDGKAVASGSMDLLTVSGQAEFDLHRMVMSLKLNCRGVLDEWYHRYLRLTDSKKTNIVLANIENHDGTPVEFTIDVPEVSLLNFADISVEGKISASNFSYGGYPFAKATCQKYEANAYGVFVYGIKYTTVAGDTGEVDLQVKWYPGMYVRVSHVRVRGNPESVSCFFHNLEAQKVYSEIFQKVKWGKTEVQMPSLEYMSIGDEWTVKSRGIFLSADNVEYCGYPMKNAHAVVALNLPRSVTVEPICLELDNTLIHARAEVFVEGIPRCDFKIFPVRGVGEVLSFVSAIHPKSKSLFAKYAFSDRTWIDCQGSVGLLGNREAWVKGRLNGDLSLEKTFKLDDVSASWSFENGNIIYRVSPCHFYGGDAALDGYYNLNLREGRTLMEFNDIPMFRLRNALYGGERTAQEVPGTVWGKADLTFQHDWANTPWNITGTWDVHIRDGNLWELNFMSVLGKMLSSKMFGFNIGKIRTMDAQLEAHGTFLELTKLVTDGTLISLDATGKYDWKTDELEVNVRGVPVKDIKLLSLILSPLSWSFQAVLSGPIRHPTWRMKTFLETLF